MPTTLLSPRHANARMVIEAFHDAVLLVDLDDARILEMNDRACSLYGRTRSELTGATLATVGDDFARSCLRLRNTLERERFGSFSMKRKALVIEVQAGLLEASEHLVAITVHRNLTKETRVREQLQVAASDWRMTFDAIEQSVLVVGRDGVIERANRSACALAGNLSFAELLGKKIEDVSPQHPWKRAGYLVAEVFGAKTPASTQTTDPETGQTWDISATFAGAAPRVVVVIKNITDIVVLEASLRRNERVAEMGHLVGAVAHEVRNPLFVISASFDALEARLGTNDPVVAAHLVNLDEQISRLSALMHDLLEYGKPPEMNITLSPLETAIEDAISHARQRAQKDSIAVDNQFPAGLGSVLMDQARLSRALENLLENAIHHSPPGSRVIIRGGKGSNAVRTWIWCSIEDSGPGFGGGDPAKVFEPFFSKRPGGTGLGLSIVQRTVEAHGGRIIAANADGGGARMTLELPRVDD